MELSSRRCLPWLCRLIQLVATHPLLSAWNCSAAFVQPAWASRPQFMRRVGVNCETDVGGFHQSLFHAKMFKASFNFWKLWTFTFPITQTVFTAVQEKISNLAD